MKISSKIAISLTCSLFCFVQSNAQIDVINTTNDHSLNHELIDEVYESTSSDFHFTENKGPLISSVKYHCKLHIGNIFLRTANLVLIFFQLILEGHCWLLLLCYSYYRQTWSRSYCKRESVTQLINIFAS